MRLFFFFFFTIRIFAPGLAVADDSFASRPPRRGALDERAQDIEQGQKLLFKILRQPNLFVVEMENVVRQTPQIVKDPLRCAPKVGHDRKGFCRLGLRLPHGSASWRVTS